jgi:DNA-binding CsgD family transcriptional regulator/tetratricopeptide (TPR) repeat protein
LAQIRALLSAATAGEAAIAVLEGPPGIGKSRLLAHAAAVASDADLIVATGAADELDRMTPWGPLLEALSSTSPAILSTAELMSLAGMIDGRLEVLDRIRAALESAARRRPVLIGIDDLQWADPSTMLALGSLSAQLFSYPIVWLLGRRPFPASPQMQTLLERLDAQGMVRLALGPLSTEATTGIAADLLGQHPSPRQERLVARAEGNPLYIVELLRGDRRASESGQPPRVGHSRPTEGPSPGDDPDVARSLSSVVVDHLRSLSDDTRRLIQVAAVLGPTFSAEELSAITGQPAADLLAPVGDALAADVLVDSGSNLAFQHDLFRQSVYDDVPEPLRLALHRDAARVLVDSGAPVLRIATHLAIGARAGDEQAIETLGQAVGELFGTSPSDAADLAIRILELISPGDPRRPGYVAAAVQMLGWSGRVDGARALGEEFLAGNVLPVALEAQIELGMRRAWLMHTGVAYPAPLPDRLVSDEEIPAAVRANLLVVDQNRAILDEPPEGVARRLEQAAQLVVTDGDAIDVAFVQSIRLGLEQEQGNLLAALACAQQPLAGFPDPPDRAAAIRDSSIASCLSTVGRPIEALEMLEQALPKASSSGQTIIVARSHSIRAMVLLELGRIDDARAEGEAAAALAEDLGFGYYLGQALITVIESALHQGDVADARAAADWLIARSPDEPMGDAYWAAALCADAAGRQDATRRALAPMAERLARSRFVVVDWYPSRLPQMVAMAVRARAPDQAQVAVGAAVEIARRNPGVVSATGAALHARGLLGHDTSLLRQAVETFAPGERPLATAGAREDLGHALGHVGAPAEAIVELEAAYETYLRIGAQRDVARVRAALRALGVRKRQMTPARAPSGWESLTKSERVVVELVARGLTNREAAGELFLSPDTINTHLRHAFAKLNIRSRVQLARLAAERDRAPA